MCCWENAFLTSMWNFIHKVTLSQVLKKSFLQRHMLVDFEYILLCKSFVFEIWHYQHRDGLMTKNSWQKNNYSSLGRVSKLAAMNFFLTTTHVGRFRISLFVWIVWTWSFSTYVINIQMVLWQNFHGKKNSILGRVSKLIVVKFFSRIHMFVDFEYLFLCKSFGLEIWHANN